MHDWIYHKLNIGNVHDITIKFTMLIILGNTKFCTDCPNSMWYLCVRTFWRRCMFNGELILLDIQYINLKNKVYSKTRKSNFSRHSYLLSPLMLSKAETIAKFDCRQPVRDYITVTWGYELLRIRAPSTILGQEFNWTHYRLVPA